MSKMPVVSSSSAVSLLALADKMDRLATDCLEPWLLSAKDPMGGAFGFLDREFRPVVDAEGTKAGPSNEARGDKSLIQQSRHLYSYSLMVARRPGDERAEALAHHLFDFIESKMTKEGSGALVHQLDANARVREDQLQAYAQSFATYGLATYALCFREREPARARRAEDMAREAFLAWDSLRHDEEFGGYDQKEDGGWLEYVLAPSGARKCTNTHIHLLEALTPLYELNPSDKQVEARLREMIDVICDRLLQNSGYVHKHFDRAWAPVGEPECSYGHDLETSWLVRDAARFFEESVREKADHAARAMAEHALRNGWDEVGGVYDYGIPERDSGPEPRVTGLEKVWWAQAESLPGIYRLYRQTRDLSLLSRLAKTLEFIRKESWDSDFGEFYWGVMSDGSLGPRGDHKGEIWKTPYHALRAFVLTSDWIREDLALENS